MRPFLSAALALLLLSAAPRAAQACGSGHGGSNNNYSGLVALVLVVGGGLAIGDLAFTAHDLSVDKSSAGAGVGEALLAAPQVALGVAWLGSNTSSRAGAAVYTAWMSALLVHGIYAIATANDSASPPVHGFTEAEARSQPAALGLGMTFVDVGSRSAPGLGLVGRF